MTELEERLTEENTALRQRVAELERWISPPAGWGHSGPCSNGCTCVNSGTSRVT